jgi:hypothetical protein
MHVGTSVVTLYHLSPQTSANNLRSIVAPLVVLTAIVGCRSSGQTDLVEREMRQQEDQIYALQDYLNNYQQLLCESRAENESLKQQLATGQPTETTPLPQREPSKSRLKSPAQTPIPPSRKENGPRLDQPEPPPSAPKPEMGDPEVPPLRDTSAADRRGSRDSDPPSNLPPNRTENVVQPASYEVPVDEPAVRTPLAADAPTVTDEESSHAQATTDPPQQVVLQGQVVTDGEDNQSPHLLVDVKPQLASGQPVDFRGSLSLMVMDPNGARAKANLARWDFTADDLDQAILKTVDGPLLEFPLQLPPTVPTDRPLELWVRLLPENGGKVLAHATVDLSRANQFCSAIPSEMPIIERAVQIVDGRPSPSSPQFAVHETGWQVARPDQPTDHSPRQGGSTSGWHTATQVVPMIESVATRPNPPIMSSTSAEPIHSPPPACKVAEHQAPEWSPERAGDAKAAEPAWSPTR